jgi:imidazole glycerol-phosphate synthase subunit HisH
MSTIAVIDYGMGNLRSVSKALEHVAPEARVVVTHRPEQILAADRVVLPGVGAIRDCMEELHRLELTETVREAAASLPFLGICLGMQALLEHSEENDGTPGLGVLPGRVRRFPEDLSDGFGRLKIPHMGWNTVRQRISHPLWEGIPDASRFYFVHSFYAAPDDSADLAGETSYGFAFASAIARANVFAVQFHPEKSQRAGLRLLANFARWEGGG